LFKKHKVFYFNIKNGAKDDKIKIKEEIKIKILSQVSFLILLIFKKNFGYFILYHSTLIL